MSGEICDSSAFMGNELLEHITDGDYVDFGEIMDDPLTLHSLDSWLNSPDDDVDALESLLNSSPLSEEILPTAGVAETFYPPVHSTPVSNISYSSSSSDSGNHSPGGYSEHSPATFDEHSTLNNGRSSNQHWQQVEQQSVTPVPARHQQIRLIPAPYTVESCPPAAPYLYAIVPSSSSHTPHPSPAVLHAGSSSASSARMCPYPIVTRGEVFMSSSGVTAVGEEEDFFRRKEDRKIRNRAAAQASRQRKKVEYDQLTRECQGLANECSRLRAENEQLQRQLGEREKEVGGSVW